jgi:hypothetical protein
VTARGLVADQKRVGLKSVSVYLKKLFMGVIISTDTPTHERGVKVLGSILRNSHEDYITTRLERMLRKAINTHVVPLLHLHRLQDRYHFKHKSFMHRFTHIFRTLPPCHTQTLPPCHTQKFAKVVEERALRLLHGWTPHQDAHDTYGPGHGAGPEGALLPALPVVQGGRHGPGVSTNALPHCLPGLLDLAPHARGR